MREKCFSSCHCVCSPPANCFASSVNCRAANYWYSGFIRLQSLIDAAIIQVRKATDVKDFLPFDSKEDDALSVCCSGSLINTTKKMCVVLLKSW